MMSSLLGFIPVFPVSKIKSLDSIFQEELVGIFGATSEQDLGLGVLDQRHLENRSLGKIPRNETPGKQLDEGIGGGARLDQGSEGWNSWEIFPEEKDPTEGICGSVGLDSFPVLPEAQIHKPGKRVLGFP